MTGRLHQFCHPLECLLAVAHNGHIHLHILVYLAGINIEVYDAGLLGVGFQFACHTIVEAHADGDKQVTLVGHHVGTQVAVHSQHAQCLTMRCRKRPQPHQ